MLTRGRSFFKRITDASSGHARAPTSPRKPCDIAPPQQKRARLLAQIEAQNSTSLGAKIETQNNAQNWTSFLLRHEARLQFGAPIWGPISGSKLDPRFSPLFGFKNAPASENVSHLPRDKFSVDRSRFASCMLPMVTSATSSHSSLHPFRTNVSDSTKSAILTVS